jgi:hypothetical protein
MHLPGHYLFTVGSCVISANASSTQVFLKALFALFTYCFLWHINRYHYLEEDWTVLEGEEVLPPPVVVSGHHAPSTAQKPTHGL